MEKRKRRNMANNLIYFECDDQTQLVFSFLLGMEKIYKEWGSYADIGIMPKNTPFFIFNVRPSLA